MSKRFLSAGERAVVALFVLAALVLDQGYVRASELQATKNFADVAVAVEHYVEKFGAEHVLLALDIDNTVMSMDGDLGSDHWFEWQQYLLGNEPNSPHLVAKTFDGLLDAQRILYDRQHMRPTEADQPAIIAGLQKLGISTILLTSRGPSFRGDTERELKRCGYNFAKTALPVHNVPDKEYLAYDAKNPESGGLTAAELEKYKMPPPKPVSYANGIFMTAGQHKGLMLLTLLEKSTRDIKAIVYVDDNVHHVGNVFAACLARNIEVTSIHYFHEEVIVQRFQYGDKLAVDNAWQAIKRAVRTVTVAKPQSVEPAFRDNGVSPGGSAPACRQRRRCCRCCR